MKCPRLLRRHHLPCFSSEPREATDRCGFIGHADLALSSGRSAMHSPTPRYIPASQHSSLGIQRTAVESRMKLAPPSSFGSEAAESRPPRRAAPLEATSTTAVPHPLAWHPPTHARSLPLPPPPRHPARLDSSIRTPKAHLAMKSLSDNVLPVQNSDDSALQRGEARCGLSGLELTEEDSEW